MPGSSERTRNELPPPLEPVERTGMVATIKWALQGGNLGRKYWQSLRPNQNASRLARGSASKNERPEKPGRLVTMGRFGGSLLRRHQGARFGLRRARGVPRVAIDEGRRLFCRLGAGKRHHLAVIGRERASRIGVAGIAGDGHGLAAASAEVDLAERARAAGLLHPFRAAEGVEGI